MIHSQEKNQLIESDLQMIQMLELADKKFTTAILTMLKDLKAREVESSWHGSLVEH